jgi:hypothetical protein
VSSKVSELDTALWERISHIVRFENRPFSYVDFIPTFELNGKTYSIAKGTFRNKMSNMLKTDRVETVCCSPQAFYTLKGVNFVKPRKVDHTGVSLSSICSQQDLRIIKNHPVYRLIQNIPYDKSALHDIRLRFKVQRIWSILSKNNLLQMDTHSKDIPLKNEQINGLDIQVRAHHSDTVSVVIGCSFAPVAIDVNGVIRLSNALTLIEERLGRMIKDENSCPDIPNHMTWTVTMWHFGTDASILFKGAMFHVAWKIAEGSLVALYSKRWKDSKYKIRAERQEYPNKTLGEALEEKLNSYTRN